MIETERLLLREYTMDDYDALYEIMSDAETMKHYPAPFDEARTRRWIEWNMENYARYGFGLWAVVLRDTGGFIGDCGITIQNIDGDMLPEIGYHIHKRYQRRGFAREAARAVRDWAFENTAYDTLYSYMKYTNVGSYTIFRPIYRQETSAKAWIYGVCGWRLSIYRGGNSIILRRQPSA